MSRVVVIGGSGHVGTYLIPALVESGHEVINISRGNANPYQPHYAWNEIRQVILDRNAEEQAGTFGSKIAALQPDVVVDMISFTRASTQHLAQALTGKISQYIFCSSIWVYGRLTTVPSTEQDAPNPIDAYGTGKAESEDWLMEQVHRHGFPATCFRPGHIVGKGWVPINPAGNVNPEVFARIARGEELVLPNQGLETMHHVHADDLAQWIILAMQNRAASVGEVFNTVSDQALNMRGYAEQVYRWFGHEPKLRFKPFDEWIATLGDDAEVSRGHVIRSSCHSIDKSIQRLGYSPRYTSLQAIHESVMHLVDTGKIII